MKISAIIAEFNPFHNGHKEIISKTREITGCDHVIILMSGNYVQRGVPAILDRYTRCRAALEEGADLVLSMPTRYCTSSAENYALQSIRLLNALHIIDYLVFGSECGDLRALQACAEYLVRESSSFKENLRKYLKEGMSFPKARALASPDYENILSFPNNVLAIEYLKALIRTGSSIEPVTLKRKGADYNDDTSIEKFSSASAVRKIIENHYVTSDQFSTDCMRDLLLSVPYSSLRTQIMAAEVNGILTEEDFSPILAAKVWNEECPEAFTRYLDISKDLSSAIFNNRNMCYSFTVFAEMLKNKSVTRTHINRALMHIALGIENREDTALLACVLGCRSVSSDLIGLLYKNSAIPVVTRPAKELEMLDGPEARLLREEIRVSNLYNVFRALKKKTTVQNTLSQKFIRV